MAGTGAPVVTLGAKISRLSGDSGSMWGFTGLTYSKEPKPALPSKYGKNSRQDFLSSVFLNLDLGVVCFRYNRKT